MNETDEYRHYINYIDPKQITPAMVSDFLEYLESISKGDGAQTTFRRFKKVAKFATMKGVFEKNPCEGIVARSSGLKFDKDWLSFEEIEKLLNTPTEINPEIKRAFIFCLYMGLRHGDAKKATFENVDYINKQFTFFQNKTKGKVIIPISDYIMDLIGKPKESYKEKIFNLPTNEGCNKALKKWVEQAGITKHITWHCARHSFCTNLLKYGANPKVVQSLAGHSSLRYTEIYMRAINEDKNRAINSLPIFEGEQ